MTDCAALLNELQQQVEAKKNEAIDRAGEAFGLIARQAEILDQVESQTGDALDAWLSAQCPTVDAPAARRVRALYQQEDFRGLFAASGILPERVPTITQHSARMVRDACVAGLGKLVSTLRTTEPEAWWGGLQEHERVTLRTQAPTLRRLVALIEEDKPL